MGMKLNAAGLTARLGKRYAGLVNPGVSHVEVGVADAISSNALCRTQRNFAISRA